MNYSLATYKYESERKRLLRQRRTFSLSVLGIGFFISCIILAITYFCHIPTDNWKELFIVLASTPFLLWLIIVFPRYDTWETSHPLCLYELMEKEAETVTNIREASLIRCYESYVIETTRSTYIAMVSKGKLVSAYKQIDE